MRNLLERKEGQAWCCGGCGSGIVESPKRIDFEYSREEFEDGRVISKTIPAYVAPCCGGDLLLWDESIQDCVPWNYIDQSVNTTSYAL